MFTESFEKVAKGYEVEYSKDRAKHVAGATAKGALFGALAGGGFRAIAKDKKNLKRFESAVSKGGKVGAIAGLLLGGISSKKDK